MIKHKLLIFSFTICILCTLFAFADEQIITPKSIYVGDTAELRYMFQSHTDLFLMADPSRINGDTVILDTSSQVFKKMEDVFLVKKAVLQRVGITYTVIITFVPWVTGEISFEEWNLNELCGNNSDAAPLLIKLSPIPVMSILKRTDSSGEGNPVSPILIPGTNYVLWGLIITLLIVLVFIAIFIARFSLIAEKFLELKENIGFSRNAIITKRKLNALKKRPYSDMDFASTWQKIMRAYLEYRFGTPFSSVTASSFYSVISDLTGDMLNMEQDNAVMSLQGLFRRTDYIRYAAGSIDSVQLPEEEHKAGFIDGERDNIIDVSVSDIEGLELREKEMKLYGRV
ncbi:MAG: hypothetical protein K6G00_03685 [Treponema sp.]|nr:hypothetical protein [Treponema sp.]